MPTVPPPEDWLERATSRPAADSFSVNDPAAPPFGFSGVPGYGQAVATAPPIERRSFGRSFVRGLREVAETIIMALLIFLVVRAVVQNFQVDGGSMRPSLETGWYLLVNKALYWEINLETVNKFLPFIDPGDDPTRYLFRAPHRGDVIVFKAPGQERDFIKRIIAEPGEVVELRDGLVIIDGRTLDEPYVQDEASSVFGPVTVPPDCYFVLGDNRNNSSDSRSWGTVPKDNIIGQSWLTYWPFSSFGLVNNTSVEPMGEPPRQPDKDPVRTAGILAAAPLAACNP